MFLEIKTKTIPPLTIYILYFIPMAIANLYLYVTI